MALLHECAVVAAAAAAAVEVVAVVGDGQPSLRALSSRASPANWNWADPFPFALSSLLSSLRTGTPGRHLRRRDDITNDQSLGSRLGAADILLCILIDQDRRISPIETGCPSDPSPYAHAHNPIRRITQHQEKEEGGISIPVYWIL